MKRLKKKETRAIVIWQMLVRQWSTFVAARSRHEPSSMEGKRSVESSMISDSRDTTSISCNPVKWICIPIRIQTLPCISASFLFTGRLPHTMCSKGPETNDEPAKESEIMGERFSKCFIRVPGIRTMPCKTIQLIWIPADGRLASTLLQEFNNLLCFLLQETQLVTDWFLLMQHNLMDGYITKLCTQSLFFKSPLKSN